MNHTRLESMFHKKHAPPMHAHKSRLTRASHVHTHNTMYAHVYTCTHCGRTGHLVKFCYDRINVSNFANKFLFGLGKVLTPLDPKRYGYQKLPLLYLMQVWALT